MYSKDHGPALLVMKTSEPPFSPLTELQEALRSSLRAEAILVDQLLHTGKSDARFVSGFFDGGSFDKSRFRVQAVYAGSSLCRPMCESLRSGPETLEYCCLLTWNQESIADGNNI